jgi:hypothetical protein
MNKLLDNYPRFTREVAESARMTTTSSMSKNQPKLTCKARMILKSDEPSY